MYDPNLSLTFKYPPSRKILNFILSPDLKSFSVMISLISDGEFTFLFAAVTIISPIEIPAFWAGLFLSTCTTITPFLNGMFKCLINPLVKGCTTKPVVKLLSILPEVFNSLAILFAVLMGIAKPIPIEPRL